MQIILYIISIFSFFLTGSLQFIGLSVTTSSYVLILVISLVMLSIFLVKKELTINSYLIINFFLILWIVISAIANRTNPLLVVNYFSYVIIPVAIYFLVKSNSKDLFKLSFLINLIVIIQLPVLCLQYFLPDYTLYSHKVIASIDRMFGTFPLSSDHFLSFFLILNILYIGVKKSTLTLFNYFIIIYSILCISLTNSVTSYLFLFSTLVFIFFLRSNLYVKFSFAIISVIGLIFLYFNIYEFLGLLQKPELLDITNTKYIEDGKAGRFQTFYYIFSKPLSIFGNGPSSYFNPLMGGFQLNANFSQILWFYYDLGFVGVILLVLLIVSYLYSFKISNHMRIYLFILVFAYAFSSTILDQVVFLLTLNIFAFMFENQERKLYL